MRFDLDMIDNPKMKRCRLALGGSHSGTVLYLQAMAYSVRHLTDGWVPPTCPEEWGYDASCVRALEEVGLWIPVEVTEDGGWLINDYAQYQVTRAEWEEKSEQRRKAARKRWST
jgi:hypothetical protein